MTWDGGVSPVCTYSGISQQVTWRCREGAGRGGVGAEGEAVRNVLTSNM